MNLHNCRIVSVAFFCFSCTPFFSAADSVAAKKGSTPGQSPASSCSDPSARLSKAEILSLFSGAAFDTREGSGRYVHKKYSEYDSSRKRGIVSSTTEYQGTLDTSERVYSVSDGQLCETGLNGSPTYCEFVKRCDPEGDGVRVYLLDDQNRISTYVEIEKPVESPAQEKGRYMSPQGTMWVQVASRTTLEDARAAARQTGEGARIFRAENGWYAITSATLNEVEYENGGLERLAASNGWPSDSLLTRGSKYVEEVAMEGSESPSSTFTRTTTLRASWILSRAWRDNTPVYDRIRLAAVGESVVVFGEPDAQGDCLVDSHEGIFMKCADLKSFASPSDGQVAAQSPPKPASNEASRNISDEFYSNQMSAVTKYSTRRSVPFQFSKISFIEGKFYVTHSEVPSTLEEQQKKRIENMNKGNDYWANWFDATQNTPLENIWDLTCVFPATEGEKLSRITKGERAMVNLKIDSATDKKLLFDCRIE